MSTPNLDEWTADFQAFHARFAPLFRRSEVRARSQRYLTGLLAPVERKNGWQLAEAVGEADPLGIQRFLFEAVWDADAVRDRYQQWVREVFGDPQAVLVVDETGFLKKGTKSVGVARQYSGTAGKVENCQVAVFLAYAAAGAHMLVDRAVYLPTAWTEDRARCAAAKVPETVVFQTKPELALELVDGARAQGLPHAWVTADEAYGSNPAFLEGLEARGEAYVVAVPTTARVWPTETHLTPAAHGHTLHSTTTAPEPVAEVVAGWPQTAWHRLVVGDGSKGPRVYDWAMAPVVGSRNGWPGAARWLLARRSVAEPRELAYYLGGACGAVTRAELARVVARRWAVEQCFEEAKGETGLDQYEVRGWPSWYRHITLSMLAHGFLAWQRQRQQAGGKIGATGERRGRPPRADRLQCAGGAAAVGVRLTAAAADARPGPGVVRLAPPPSSAGQGRPHPPPHRLPTHLML